MTGPLFRKSGCFSRFGNARDQETGGFMTRKHLVLSAAALAQARCEANFIVNE
jgi:hypothetical protein